MSNQLFIQGLLLGFSIAAPVGPIGILCIQRTLNSGIKHGLVVGLGAATADAVYGSVAVLGLTVVTNFLTGHISELQLIGGIFLCYLGMKTIMAKTNDQPSNRATESLLTAYGSTFLLTITNPMTIISFTFIFAGLGWSIDSTEMDYTTAMLLVLSVFSGSGLWWLLLSFGVGIFRHKITSRLKLVNLFAGIIILGLGIISVAQIFS
jgi:threonine/homoserine/homoserine lactone efflux protein